VARLVDVLVGVAIVATLQLMENETMAQPQCDVVKLAEQHIAKFLPSFDPAGKRLVVRESGNLCEVTYELPPWMLGGAPIVTIDKRTCKVVDTRLEQ
jgi:hypothetical protein